MEGTATLCILGQPPALPLPDFSGSISKIRIPGYKSGEYEIVNPGVIGQGPQPTATPTRAATDPAATLASILAAPPPTWLLSPCTGLVGDPGRSRGHGDVDDSGPCMGQTF